MPIDARFAALLVFEQQVGHPGIGRDDEDAVVKIAARTPRDQDIVEQGGGGGHRGAADLFDAVGSGHAAASCGASGPRTTVSGSGWPRWARNQGRGLTTPNGLFSRLPNPLLTAKENGSASCRERVVQYGLT